MDPGSEIRVFQTADPLFRAAADEDAFPDILVQFIVMDIHFDIGHRRERSSAKSEAAGWILDQDPLFHDVFLHIRSGKLSGGEMCDEFQHQVDLQAFLGGHFLFIQSTCEYGFIFFEKISACGFQRGEILLQFVCDFDKDILL